MLKKLIEALDSKTDTINSGKYNPGQIMSLHGYLKGEAPVERGVGAIEFKQDAVHIYAAFEDSDIFNTATRHNEKTWSTGDVIECFIQPAGMSDYYEFHLTPENITLQLHLPPVEQRGTVPFEDEIFDGGLRTETQKYPERNLWTGEMILPFKGIGMTQLNKNGTRFAICRYNYNKAWKQPELTSTALFPGGSFHTPSQWHVIEL